MDFTTAGRLVLWLGVGLLATGILLPNTPIFLSGALLLFYLLVEGVSFHREVNIAKDSIRLQTSPSTIDTTVGRPFKVETAITNASHCEFSIFQFHHNLPTQIHEDSYTSAALTLQPHGKQYSETLLRTKIPGRFEITTSTTLLETRTHLFSETVAFPDRLIIMAQPSAGRLVDPIEAGVLEDLVVDHTRRGSGTDLAGIRPYNAQDNFHRIDWKTTSRAGKLMTKESYLERDPTVILVVDISSSMNAGRLESSTFEAFLNVSGNLLAAIRIASPMGLILYDKQEVVANIEPTQGAGTRERIQRRLLEGSRDKSILASPERRSVHPYADLVRMTNSLKKEPAFATKTKRYWERLSTFANFTLPFYERAESKYLARIRGQGAFKAFDMICDLPEPVLVIVISDSKSNLEGLVEGAKRARALNHQVVLVSLTARTPTKEIEILSDLEDAGVGILRCTPEELPKAINAEILRLRHNRVIPIDRALRS